MNVPTNTVNLLKAIIHVHNQTGPSRWLVGIAADAVDQLFLVHFVAWEPKHYLYVDVEDSNVADEVAKELAREPFIERCAYRLSHDKQMVYAYRVTVDTIQCIGAEDSGAIALEAVL